MFLTKFNLLVSKVIPPSKNNPFIQVFTGQETYNIERGLTNATISKGDLINIRFEFKKIVRVITQSQPIPTN